ncbi:MAG: hypothetical protein U0X73_04085 [Thermoanaerobaculia bacterium]
MGCPRPRRARRHRFLIFVLTLFLPALARAQAAPPPEDPSVAALRREIAELRADYEQRLAALEAKLAALAAAESPPPPQPQPTPPPQPAPPTGGGAQTANYFNPAISLIGNYLAVGGHNPEEDLPNSSLRESEIGLQAVVDPYARADVFLSFGEQGVEVEEGFVTFTALPAQLLAKVGRMRAGFGKINTLHLHSLPWADEPLPIVHQLGGEEGWVGTGVSLAKLLPIGDTFTELTVQAFHADSQNLWATEKRDELAYNAHYRLFGDLTDATNLDLGLSYALGPNGSAPGNQTTLAGLDFTYRWKPLRTATYRGAIVRGEVIHSDREQPGGREGSLGWFLSGEYQLARRWWVGARIESAERANDSRSTDDGGALTLTFNPSEFSQLRGELRRRRYADAVDANEVLLQLQFIIGAHGAHPF